MANPVKKNDFESYHFSDEMLEVIAQSTLEGLYPDQKTLQELKQLDMGTLSPKAYLDAVTASFSKKSA